MYLVAEELIAPGGPSAPVWIFITTTTAGIIALIGQQLAAKRSANEAQLAAVKAAANAKDAALEAKGEAAKAAVNAKEANQNTTNLSNGFASAVNEKLDRIQRSQDELATAFRHHLEMHLRDKN